MSCAVNHTYDAKIRAAASTFAIDPALLKAHVARESYPPFNPDSYRYEANVGDASYGLAQVRYKVAQSLGLAGPPDDLYDPGTNLYYAAKLMAQNLAYARGDLPTAISAYNAGFGNPPARTGRRRADGTFINQSYVDGVLACIPFYEPDFAAPPLEPDGGPVIGLPASSPLTSKLVVAGLALLAGLVALLVIVAKGRP